MNILNKLTIKHLTMNKKRTIVSIMGIVLSTALMVGIGLLASTFHALMVDSVIGFEGDHHVNIENVNYKDIDLIKDNAKVKDAYIGKTYGFQFFEGKDNKNDNFGAGYVFLKGYSENYLKKVEMLTGRLPENSSEVIIDARAKYDLEQLGFSANLGDKIDLDLYNYYQGEDLLSEISSSIDETLKKEHVGKKEVTIVGTYSYLNLSYFYAGLLTTLDDNLTGVVNSKIIYKDINKTKENTEAIIGNLTGVSKDYVDYNNSLLSLYGASTRDNLNTMLGGVIAIVLTLISVGCAFVIYNSFAISVMERKKQFGLFASVGATKKQIRKTVFFEALIVGIIGIILGLLGAFLGIFIVIQVVNLLIGDILGLTLRLAIVPLFLIIPIIYMIATIAISAFLPARSASKISPIKAIRLNDDIKISNKKIRSSKLVAKLFGVEGDLAFKNIKRNKKKYRITIISLFISIVLFISFSTFLEYGTKATQDTLNIVNYDITVGLKTSDKTNDIINKIKNLQNIDRLYSMRQYYATINFTEDELSADFVKLIKNDMVKCGDKMCYQLPTIIQSIDNDTYREFLKNENLSSDYLTSEKGLIINKYSYFDKNSNKKRYVNPLGKNDYNKEFKYDAYGKEDNTLKQGSVNFVRIDKEVDFVAGSSDGIVIVVNNDYFSELFKESDYLSITEVRINAKEHGSVTKAIQDIMNSGQDDGLIHNVFDIAESTRMQNNMFMVVSILLYGFISLVTLIGVTSVFNTINTSMGLRRKEFAVLRSVGLSPKGFNKMLRLESIFYGVKSLLYSLPVAFLIVLWFNSAFGVSVDLGILIPWTAIIIAVVGVFIITFITMNYATRKIKKENILDAIREENI